MRAGRRDKLGPMGERVAARHLRRRGYRVLGRNLMTRFGEADLLCEGPCRCVVVVEVKARRFRQGVPPPEASVTQTKRRKLVRVLEHLAKQNGWSDRPRRIDVVSVEFHARRWLPPRATVRHFENAVMGNGRPR